MDSFQDARYKDAQYKPEFSLIASGAAILTVSILILLKIFAYYENGSASILASLIDSIMDASVSCMTFFALRLSLKPADHEHRYGHGKIEGLSALFQAAFIASAGAFLLLESYDRLQNPIPLTESGLAVIVMASAAFLSSLLISVQTYVLSRAPSLAIRADRAHYSMDVLINLGAMAILVALQKGWPAWIDPAFAGAVALYLGWTGFTISRQALDMLLDRELPEDVRARIKDKVLAHDKILGMHDLRTSQSGMRIFISFDVELNPQLLLCEAHDIVREVELDLLQSFPAAEILIHADPYGDTADSRHQISGLHDRPDR